MSKNFRPSVSSFRTMRTSMNCIPFARRIGIDGMLAQLNKATQPIDELFANDLPTQTGTMHRLITLRHVDQSGRTMDGLASTNRYQAQASCHSKWHRSESGYKRVYPTNGRCLPKPSSPERP